MQKVWQQIQWKFSLPGVVSILLILALKHLGGFQSGEWWIFDRYLHWQPIGSTDSRILIIGINETDLQQIKSYPISDAALVRLLEKIQVAKPAAIGIDLFRDLPQPPGEAKLAKFLQQNDHVIGIDKLKSTAQSPLIKPHPALPMERVGFADAIVDRDGSVRRVLLGDFNQQAQFRFAFSTLLAEKYLTQRGIILEPGRTNPDTMRFGPTEIPMVTPHTGGYVNTDAGGIQTLIRFRSGVQPFQLVSMGDILAGRVSDRAIAGKVILIGMMAPSVKDFVTSEAVSSPNPSMVYGLEVQAHAVSQILAATLDNRALIQTWPDVSEDLWLIAWGAWGIILGWQIKAPHKLFGLLLLSILGLIGIGYICTLMGWWIPIAAPLTALGINSIVLTTIYRYHQILQIRVSERQEAINQTFNAIHNGPLQTLAAILGTGLLTDESYNDCSHWSISDELSRM